MLSSENEAFLAYWEKEGTAQRTSKKPLLVGLSAGFAIGVGIELLLESGWYERASMVANSRLSSVIMVLAIVILSVFMAYFYRKFRWEMMEQRYQELKAAKKRIEKNDACSPNV